MKKKHTAQKDREYPNLSQLCAMYEAAKEPDGLAGYYGTFGTAQCEAYNEACAELGDRVHKALECWETGHPVVLPDAREQYMVDLITKWITETGMRAVSLPSDPLDRAIEVELNSKLLDYSCRADRVVTFGSDPTVWIGDYKTSASMKDSYRLQLAGYALGWYEKTGQWVDDGFILRVEKKPAKKPQIEAIEVHELWRWLEPLALTRQMWSICHRKNDWKECPE